MGKTKTAVISGVAEDKDLSGAEKYKLKQQKKAAAEAAQSAKSAVKGIGAKGGERIAVVSGEIVEETEVEEAGQSPKAKRGPRVRGKAHKTSSVKIDRNKVYPIAEALKLVKDTSFTKFDGTFELHATLKKVGTSARVALPHSAGKQKVVEVASEATLKALDAGKVEFDILLSTPEMMAKLVKYAKILGPRGLMPNPKNGTIIKDEKDAKSFSTDTITVRTERKAPILHVSFGKVSQSDKELAANLSAIIKALDKRQFVKATICASMSPGVKIKVN